MRDRHRGKHLQRCRLGDRRTPHMRVDLHSMRLRQRYDMARRGDAAARADIGLRDVNRTGGEKFTETVKGVLVLATCDRHR